MLYEFEELRDECDIDFLKRHIPNLDDMYSDFSIKIFYFLNKEIEVINNGFGVSLRHGRADLERLAKINNIDYLFIEDIIYDFEFKKINESIEDNGE